MLFNTLAGLAATVASAQAVSQGFNYGNVLTDGSAKQAGDFEAEFKRAQTLQGTSGFTSARLYTMIQSGTTSDPIAAIQPAIDTQTSLLLGLWASAGQDAFTNEINALNAAIDQFGDAFTSLVVGISVGSEDLYRVSPTGIENNSGLGATPDELVSYIQQTRDAIGSTSLSGASVGHVDTWTAWVNGSNSAVIDSCDWLGMDTYPYFQTTIANSIENANQTFWDAYDATAGVSSGKQVWITETGWPVSGDTANLAVPSVNNAETYWQEVACALLGNYNTWWYTLQDAEPTTPNPSFGIIGSDLSSAPLYDLTCKASNSTSSAKPSQTKGHGVGAGAGRKGSSAATYPTDVSRPGYAPYATGNGTYGAHATGGAYATGTATHATGTDAPHNGAGHLQPTSIISSSASFASGAPIASQTVNAAAQAGSAIGAGVFALFGLVAAW